MLPLPDSFSQVSKLEIFPHDCAPSVVSYALLKVDLSPFQIVPSLFGMELISFWNFTFFLWTLAF